MPGRERPAGDELREYIINNIDRAVSEKWIKVFYQPVVRTITGEICGMEALARWVDPDFGMISPLEFIGTLEDAKLIHKLDCFMVEQICEDYAKVNVDGAASGSTVSFNLSRLDFSLCDIHKVIEEAIKKNKVPREVMRIEITESTLEMDSNLMHDVIDRFWERGFRVWMDDFGSGYSSLNVLKDYHFDTLKIDMVFLRSFDPRSREIIRAVVDMAKRIGIHTLAEGVETAEQLEFLKSIGCEKAQGYYIGRPMPYEECFSYIVDSGLTVESAAKRQYYHDIGRINVLSATPLNLPVEGDTVAERGEEQIPLAIIEYEGNRIKYLFSNEAYSKLLGDLGVGTINDIETEFSEGRTDLRERFSSMFIKAQSTSEVISADFMVGNHFCVAKVRSVAGYPGGNAFLVIFQDLTEGASSQKNTKLSDALRSMCNIYDNIVVVDLKTGYSESIFSAVQFKGNYFKAPAAEELRAYADNEIYPDDREGYIAFSDLNTVEERLAQTSTGHFSEPFRTKVSDGTYNWMLYSVITEGKPEDRRILFCMRKLPAASIARLYGERTLIKAEGTTNEINAKISGDVLWKNFCNNSDLCFFWKDRDRRFLGASKRFKQYFGFDSDDMFVGRTDEDMGWHINIEPFKSDEERVLSRGEQTIMVPGTCICKGEIREILATKIPLYLNGNVVGLIGYFIDITDKDSIPEELIRERGLDRETGALNFLGLVEALLKYQAGYISDKNDFVMILFALRDIKQFRNNYGSEWVSALMKEVGIRLKNYTGSMGLAGRINAEHFMVVKKSKSDTDVVEFIKGAYDAVESIHKIDGIDCTPYLKSGVSRYSVQETLQQMFAAAQDDLTGSE